MGYFKKKHPRRTNLPPGAVKLASENDRQYRARMRREKREVDSTQGIVSLEDPTGDDGGDNG